MPISDADTLLVMLRDPNCESAQIAAAAGVPREEAGRASRLVMGISRAKPEELATLPAPLALAVLRAAAGAGRADLLAAAAGHPSKEVAKEGKRALYLLRSRGVAVPELPRVAPPAPAPAPEPVLPCYASAIDGHGERAVWIGRSIPGKGIEIAQAVTSDVKGLVELHLGFLGRKEYRAFGRDLIERGRVMGVSEVDRDRAHAVVAAARRLNDASGTRVPEGADAWLARLGPAGELPDPAAGFPPLPDEEERAAVAASGQLHELALVRGWLADEPFLRGLAQKLDEIAVSSLYLDERQRAEAAARTVTDATAAHFDAERRALWSARLLALAEHLQGSGDAASATRAAAAARALRAGAPPDQVPFARLLVEKAFPAARPAPAPAPAETPAGILVPPSR